jgi:hypothetical protein
VVVEVEIVVVASKHQDLAVDYLPLENFQFLISSSLSLCCLASSP